MTKKQIQHLTEYLDELFPNAGCELIHEKDYEFVIEVMLSAQSTDIAVNIVSSRLFNRYRTIDELAEARIEEIENIIHPLGLYKNKARNIIGIAQKLRDDFDYIVPFDKELLQKLPGVGNKTAGVIRAEVFHIPDLPVDTHISRITKRLGIVKKDDDPYTIEMKLKKLIDESCWIKTHHQLIHFGRYFCTARKPHCLDCKIHGFCKYKG
ncbi:MAG: endonuclease III [Bacilli bacterium]